MKRVVLIVPIILLWSVSLVFAASPVGKWKTIDDETKKEKSIIEIYEQGGKYFGKILTLLQEPNGGAGKLCTKCTGADLNKPIVGMVNLKDMKQDGEEYSGGTIMDPASGKTYKCKMKVIEDGKKLQVRGFIGISLLGKTQEWVKVD